MIVIDTSALIAIQFDEPEAAAFKSILRPRTMVGAPTLLEYYLVVGGRFGDDGRREAAALVERLDLAVINFNEEMVAIAADAFMRFGKGKHKARLNFGDCMAYALAKSLDAPLLYKGGDFALYDIRPAL
jgi:ribonuclease VapC